MSPPATKGLKPDSCYEDGMLAGYFLEPSSRPAHKDRQIFLLPPETPRPGRILGLPGMSDQPPSTTIVRPGQEECSRPRRLNGGDDMRTAVGIGIGISVLIILNEFQYMGRTSLALVIIAISAVLVIYGVALWNLVEKH